MNQYEILQVKVFDKEAYFGSEANASVSGATVTLSKMGVDPEAASIVRQTFLPLNPITSVTDEPRINSMVQTNSPGRFILLDWGTGMHTMTIQAQTGKLLSELLRVKPGDIPTIVWQVVGNDINNFSYEKLISIPRDPNYIINEKIVQSSNGIVNNIILDLLNNKDNKLDTLIASIDGKLLHATPVQLLAYSGARYLLFKHLQYVYENFDSNSQMMKLEWMGNEYWGMITDLTYTIDSGNPWNIKYNFTYQYIPPIPQNLLPQYNTDQIEPVK